MKIITAACLTIWLGVSTAEPININTADATTLANTISGVGLSRAQSIVEYRDSNGSFSKVDDLIKIKGIGIKTVDKNREKLSVTDPTQDLSPAKP